MLRALLFLGTIAIATAANLDTIYEWNYFDYKWINENHKEYAAKNGLYNLTKPVLIDVDRSIDGRTFVTVIRSNGVPASLNIVSKEKGPGGHLLEPYPSWNWTNLEDCNKAIVNVYRIAIDHCDRLWVLDTGEIGMKQICSPQLLVFDLADDTLLKRIKIPVNLARNSETKIGHLVTPIVETYGRRCDHTNVYMADNKGHGLVIYNGYKFWRLESSIYRPDPLATNFSIDGVHFQYEEGVLGMTLAPQYGEDSTILYFKSLSSFDINSVSTADLRMSQLGRRVKYYKHRNVLPSQCAAIACSSAGTIFFGLTKETSIACWNHLKPMNKKHMTILVEDKERLQFVSGMKIVSRFVTGLEEELWVATNRLQKVRTGTMDFTEVNFRILKGNVDHLTTGTSCKAPWYSLYAKRLRGPVDKGEEVIE